MTPGAAAPEEDFKAYDVDTPAAPTEAAPPDPPAEDEWSAFADAPGEPPAEEPPANAPAAEAEDFGDFDAAPPTAASPPESPPESPCLSLTTRPAQNAGASAGAVFPTRLCGSQSSCSFTRPCSTPTASFRSALPSVLPIL